FQPPDATPQKTKKKNQNFYSPTTGTCQMSPFSSPTSHNTQNPRNPPAEGWLNIPSFFLQHLWLDSVTSLSLLDLQSRVRSSLARILKIRANLKSLQALEGSRELENILGPSDSSRSLSTELQKTQTLMSQAEELHLLKPNHGKVPAR
ncbi:CENPR protein, partial [Sapayoa aenigma]|nr:CENPR protein [Sapayoa aenigma]